jgi:hypothetical protein
MNDRNNNIIVEESKGELVATNYSHVNQIIGGQNDVYLRMSNDVDILRRLLNVVDLEKDAEDIVTVDYICKKLQLTNDEIKALNKSVNFEYFRFPVMDIPNKINEWKKADSIMEFTFSGEELKKKIIIEKSTLEIDITKGMVRILPMKQWGEAGGVYAVRLLSDSERRTEIKLVLKYKEKDKYVFSEFVTVKPSDLVYEYEGMAELKRQLCKLKKLMDYSPVNNEPLNYKQLYVALCLFNNKITSRIIKSDRLGFEEVYEILVMKVYELANSGVGDSIFGNGYYILTREELTEIADLAGYSVKELVRLLKERGMLETDTDKLSRNQKTVNRGDIKGKYYCVLTSEKYNKQYNSYDDMLSVSEEEYEECRELYESMLVDNVSNNKKISTSNKTVVAWQGGEEYGCRKDSI